MHFRRTLVILISMSILIGVAASPLLGQGDTIITITAPGWVSRAFSHEVFEPFEAQHPGIKVVIAEAGDSYYYPSAAEDIEKHLDGAQKYASSADVVYIDSHIALVEATRAGYFMNLAPYMSGDASFNPDDFFPTILQSAQWDDGTWYIPASAYVGMMLYDAKAFDQAGLPYPNAKWTFDEFANTVRALTSYDKEGKVLVSGFQMYDPALFFYGLTKQPFYDVSSSPSIPKFDNPDLPVFLDAWKALVKDTAAQDKYDFDKTAFRLGAPWQLNGGNGNRQWTGSYLPGDVSSLSIEGFAVSGGTLNPELAFALANFVSSSPEIIDAFGGDTPARRSMINANSNPSKDAQAIGQALEKAVPLSELRFEDYVEAALNKNNDDGSPVDMKAALQEAQSNAEKGLAAAAARQSTSSVYVVTPVPTPMMSENQIVLHFGLGMDMTANQAPWQQLVNDFLMANPNVGNVEFDTDFFQPADFDKLDCFYQPYNQVPSMKLEDFLSIEPFMDADPNVDRNDFIGTVLDQMQRDGHTWGYPIIMQPSVMWYDQDLFTQAGLPSPEQGWTVDQFEDALRTLKGLQAKETDPVFVPGTYGNSYLLMLIAAFGGIPYDYRTTPPTINFTDPAAVDAIRQVLDLAKNGYIGYQALVGRNFFSGDLKSPITDDVFANYSYRLMNRLNPTGQDSYRVTNFPHGSQYIPVAYEVGAAYIQNYAQSPDACYDWISYLAKRPDLLGGMPVRLSQINDPTITTSMGEDISAVYKGFAETFQNPNTLTFPGPYGAPDGNFSAFVEPLWLNRAFDRYILESGDLDHDLSEAETFAKAYRECASTIPAVDLQADLATEDGAQEYYRKFADCAIKVDPTMKEQFSYLYDGSTSISIGG